MRHAGHQARRKFYELTKLHPSPAAGEAVRRIAALYAIEEQIRGKPPDERLAVRAQKTRPLLHSLRGWLNALIPTLSGKSALAMAIHYTLNRWDALNTFAHDGRAEIDNNAVERAVRAVALGRKNFLFVGSQSGGERAAAMYSLIGTAKLNGIEPEAYLRHVLGRIAEHPVNQIDELLPWNVTAQMAQRA